MRIAPRIVAALAILTSTPPTSAHAQQIQFGVSGGASIASASTTLSFPRQSIGTFHAGGLIDFAIGDRWAIRTQAVYAGKGYSFDTPDHSHTIRMYSLDIPIHGVIRTSSGLFVGAGPNFAVNLHGTNRLSNGASGTHDYTFDGSPFEYKRFDFGVSATVGYQMRNGVFVSANYLKGVSDRLINTDAFTSSHNALSFSAGFMFR